MAISHYQQFQFTVTTGLLLWYHSYDKGAVVITANLYQTKNMLPKQVCGRCSVHWMIRDLDLSILSCWR